MHIETLRKHRRDLVRARREIRAKLELLDVMLAEALQGHVAVSPRRALHERAADIARKRDAESFKDASFAAAIEGEDAVRPAYFRDDFQVAFQEIPPVAPEMLPVIREGVDAS